MQGIIKVLDQSGHSTIAYDTDTGEGVDDARKALADAEANNANVFDTSQSPGKKMDPPNIGTASEMTVVPAFQGG